MTIQQAIVVVVAVLAVGLIVWRFYTALEELYKDITGYGEEEIPPNE